MDAKSEYDSDGDRSDSNDTIFQESLAYVRTYVRTYVRVDFSYFPKFTVTSVTKDKTESLLCT